MVVRLLVVRREGLPSEVVLGCARILDDILGLGLEDLALEEGPDGEHEEDEPDRAHEDGHDEVPGEESLQLKGVSEHADGRDPANCDSAVNTNSSFGSASATYR